MEELPVLLLTDLIALDEMQIADDVKNTHEVFNTPIGIRLPMESKVSLRCSYNHENYSEFRYTPRAYFAVKVWEAARERLLALPEFANALDIEWYPVAASFNSIRFVNGYPDEFIRRMFEEMEQLANSRTIEIQYGRFDEPALPSRPDYPRRFYIIPPKMFVTKRNCCVENELKSMQGTVAERMSWENIKDTFVVLKPIQLAFIAGNPMNRHTPLDEEFITACSHFDYEKVRELVEKGANIHATGKYGETALSEMTLCYHDIPYTASNDDEEEEEDDDDDDIDDWEGFYNGDDDDCVIVRDNHNYDNYIKIANYLLSLGYNINIEGYNNYTALYPLKFIDDLRIARFLLDNGADPNMPSCIGDCAYGIGIATLHKIWIEHDIYPESTSLNEISKILLLHGALPVTKDEKMDENELDEWIEKQVASGCWDKRLCGTMTKLDAALVHSALYLLFYDLARLAQSGGNINQRDERGRNILQIVLEEAHPYLNESISRFKDNLMEMTLMMLCGLKLKLSAAEVVYAKRTCKSKGYLEALEAIEIATGTNNYNCHF